MLAKMRGGRERRIRKVRLSITIDGYKYGSIDMWKGLRTILFWDSAWMRYDWNTEVGK